MKIIPFGTNGFFPSFNRASACYVIPIKKTLIILDAGTGLFRFAESRGKQLLEGFDEIHIFLSHYHLDHTFGFYSAFRLFSEKKVRVFAKTQRQVFWEFVKLKHFPINYEKAYANFRWEELRIGKNRIGDYEVSVRKQFHRGEGSLAFRFKFKDAEMAYVTDSEPTTDSIDFVRKVPLLLHEHEIPPKDAENKELKLEELMHDGHVTTLGAVLIAKEARVGKLVLIHHNPFADNKKLGKSLILAKTIFPETVLAEDLREIDF